MLGCDDCALSYKAKRSYSESFEHRDAFWGWSIYEQQTGGTGIGRNKSPAMKCSGFVSGE